MIPVDEITGAKTIEATPRLSADNIQPRLTTIPALTGLRGLAVLLVIINHIWLTTHHHSKLIDRLKVMKAMWTMKNRLST